MVVYIAIGPIKIGNKSMSDKHNIKQILEDNFWISSLKPDYPYFVTNDDYAGRRHEGITVTIDSQGDAWISINDEDAYCNARIRTFAGGGHNHRTRNALMILAEAIRLDNDERECKRKLK